ncbi:MAG: TonB-dependent receptor [Bacteroidota bacterium]
MRVRALRFFLFLLFSLQSSLLKGQTSVTVHYEKTPLKVVLDDIEAKTALRFSYSNELISGKTVTLETALRTVDVLLTQLSNNTKLVFEKIGDNQVIISLPHTKTSVCGYLFDIITKTPLPLATIVIKGTTRGYTTDEDGYFTIQEENLTRGVLIQYVGYTSRLLYEADFNTNACKNIFLNPQAASLSEVVVRSYLIQGIDKNKDGSLTLTSNEQGILPGLVEPDILQSVQWLPGITSIDETVSDIQIRGGAADQNLILYDGIKMYNTGHFFGMLSLFNPYVTTNATIFKSGASPEYGDRISGVIAIQGETEIPDDTSVGLGLNGTQVDAYVKARLSESIGLVVSGRRSYADIGNLTTPTYDAIFEKVFQNTIVVNDASGQTILEEEDEEYILEGEETFFFYDTNIKLIIRPSEKDSIYLNGLLTNNNLDFQLQDDENLEQDILTTENQGLSLEWSGIKADRWHHTLSAYYTDYESSYQNQVQENQTVQEENLRRNTVRDYGLHSALMYDFNKRHSVKVGYQASKNDVFYQLFRDEAGDDDIEPEDEDQEGVESSEDERDFNEISDRENTTHSIYGAYYFRPKNRGLLRLGLRASTFSLLQHWYFEPRLNAEYPLSKTLRLKVTAEKRYQTISQLIEFEDTQSRLENGTWTLTDNDDFPLLESEQYSTGLLFDHKGWTIDIDGYLKKIDGLTSFTNGFTNVSENYSQGTSGIIGLDILLKKQWGNYRIGMGYSYNNVEYRFDELQTNKFPGNNDISHNLTLSNTYGQGNWQFSLGWNFRSGAPFTPIAGFDELTGEIGFGTINSERLPDYHRLDASLQHRFKLSSKNNNQGTLGLSLQNIYARQVPLSVFYRVDEDAQTGLQEIDQVEQLSLGLTPNFLFRFTF